MHNDEIFTKLDLSSIQRKKTQVSNDVKQSIPSLSNKYKPLPTLNNYAAEPKQISHYLDEIQAYPKPDIPAVKNNNPSAKQIDNITAYPKGAAGPFGHPVKKQDKKQDNPDDFLARKRLLLVIQHYQLEFPEQLSSFKSDKFEKKSLDELKEITKQMESIITAKESLRGTQQMITSGLQMFEFAMNGLTPIKATGLSKAMLSDPGVMTDIKLVAIKRMSLVETEPESRLLYKLVTNTMLLHNINSASDNTPSKTTSAVQKTTGLANENNTELEAINKKYSDL
jgi:hypothetical protein